MVAEKRGIRVHNPVNQNNPREYDRSDVEHVMRVQDWHNWGELEKWLRTSGDDDDELTFEEVRHLAQDVARARYRGAEFWPETEKVWQELQR